MRRGGSSTAMGLKRMWQTTIRDRGLRDSEGDGLLGFFEEKCREPGRGDLARKGPERAELEDENGRSEDVGALCRRSRL